MISIQNEVGKKTEDFIHDFFRERKYWVFIIPRTVKGQPFDIIARKGDTKNIWFIDAKHLETDKVSFSFNRIEPNQITSMKYAENICGISKQMGFVIFWERTEKLYYMDWQKFKQMILEGKKSVKIVELELMDDERLKLCEQ